MYDAILHKLTLIVCLGSFELVMSISRQLGQGPVRGQSISCLSLQVTRYPTVCTTQFYVQVLNSYRYFCQPYLDTFSSLVFFRAKALKKTRAGAFSDFLQVTSKTHRVPVCGSWRRTQFSSQTYSTELELASSSHYIQCTTWVKLASIPGRSEERCRYIFFFFFPPFHHTDRQYQECIMHS